MNLTKIVKIESQDDYESTVPSTVRLANEDKVYISKPMPITLLTVFSIGGSGKRSKRTSSSWNIPSTCSHR